jgi:hypothetical protein
MNFRVAHTVFSLQCDAVLSISNVSTAVCVGELKNGFFLEAGTHDAETNSDTLHFEIRYGTCDPSIILFKQCTGGVLSVPGYWTVDRRAGGVILYVCCC